MTEPLEGEIVRTVTLLDHELTVQQPTELQTAVMARSFQRVQKIYDKAQGAGREVTDEEGRTIMSAISTWLDIFQQCIVGAEDQDWIEEMMIQRKLMYFKDVQSIMSTMNEEPEKPNRAARRAKR